MRVDDWRPRLLCCEVVKGESGIWNVLMSATGASFVVVAVALVTYSMRTTDVASGAPTEVIAASADAEAASAGSIDAGPAVADDAAAPADASAATDTLDAGADGAVDEDPADAATDESDGGSVVAAASARPAQKPYKGPPSKGKPGKWKPPRKPR